MQSRKEAQDTSEIDPEHAASTHEERRSRRRGRGGQGHRRDRRHGRQGGDAGRRREEEG